MLYIAWKCRVHAPLSQDASGRLNIKSWLASQIVAFLIVSMIRLMVQKSCTTWHVHETLQKMGRLPYQLVQDFWTINSSWAFCHSTTMISFIYSFRCGSIWVNRPASFKVADLFSIHFWKQAATDVTNGTDLNIGEFPGCGGLTFLCQIYNPGCTSLINQTFTGSDFGWLFLCPIVFGILEFWRPSVVLVQVSMHSNVSISLIPYLIPSMYGT